MKPRISIARIVAAHLAGVLLVATGAQAGGRIERTHLHRGQQAALALGDSKCIMVGEVLKCMPTIVAAS